MESSNSGIKLKPESYLWSVLDDSNLSFQNPNLKPAIQDKLKLAASAVGVGRGRGRWAVGPWAGNLSRRHARWGSHWRSAGGRRPATSRAAIGAS